MLTAEENVQLTRVGPGTLMGELMRQYWIPVVQASELAAGGRRLHRHAERAARVLLPGQGHPADLPLRRAWRRGVDLHGTGQPAARTSRSRVGPGARRSALRVEVLAGLQLSAGARGRRRSRAHLVPARRAERA